MIRAFFTKIGQFFLWLAGHDEQRDVDEGNEDVAAPEPAQQPTHWQMMIGARNVITGRVVMEIGEGLNQRPPNGRDHANDDVLLAPLANATAIAISQEEYQLAISMFYECYQLTRDYENKHGLEIHKGAMTFNVAIAFLRSHDFPAAMHYFELAKHETEQSYGHANWDVFTFDLFDRSYWNLIDLFEQEQPLDLYQDFWNTAYGTTSAKADWNALSENSKLLYIVLGAERIRYTRLKTQPNWNGADSIGLSYWNLIADLVRLLETEVREMGIVGGGLNDMVLNRI
ncbi:MAG: hypothetical protein IH987_20690, partial [Planctomycetes bacterium]|nr:hypothetical protein [Planctomycetota bacterium]